MTKPKVAIIGRPNVGKSTLFNRIIRRREAIVDDHPGVTRDRLYVDTDWSGVQFTLIDTGGYLPDNENQIHKAVLEQIKLAIYDADVIIFLVEAKTGITALDEEIHEILKKSSTNNILLVVNKVDNEIEEFVIHDFHKLAYEDPVPISASNGRNIGDFLDRVISLFPENIKSELNNDDNEIKLAVVGKPNVGKSSFINSILGVEKHIVTSIPGTTRDAIDSKFKRDNQEYIIIDTAGLRKKSKVSDNIEYYSNVRSIRSLRECDVAIVLLDATMGVQDQDKAVIEHAEKNRKGIVLAVNKWDLVSKDSLTAQQFERDIQDKIPYIQFLPVVFISALTRQRVFKVIDIAKSVYEERKKRISTSDLNEFFEKITLINPPPAPGGKYIKIKFCTQVKANPPVFAFFCNYPKLIKPNYRQFLEKKIREQYGFLGVPLTLTFRRK